MELSSKEGITSQVRTSPLHRPESVGTAIKRKEFPLPEEVELGPIAKILPSTLRPISYHKM
jgi:hypothetical protein